MDRRSRHSVRKGMVMQSGAVVAYPLGWRQEETLAAFVREQIHTNGREILRVIFKRGPDALDPMAAIARDMDQKRLQRQDLIA